MWLTVSAAARYAKKRREKFEQLIRSGAIFASFEEGTVRVCTDDIDEYYRKFPYRSRLT